MELFVLLYIFSRAIPELVWAMMIIFILKPGILPGAIALALHNFGILGKLCAEVIENLDERQFVIWHQRSIEKANAVIWSTSDGHATIFNLYFISLGSNHENNHCRWICWCRWTWLQFKLSISFFHYTDITLLLICYCFLVFIADFISEAARKMAK